MAHVTFSSWINAWTLQQALSNEGYRLESTTSGLVRHISSGPQNGDTLYFTEEDSMRRLVGAGQFHCYPRNLPEIVFDDKFAFGQLAKSIGVPTVPSWPLNDSISAFRTPCLIKAKHSWKEGCHLPRGWPCNSSEAFPAVLDSLLNQGFCPEDYFLQELLEIHPEDIYSVCGFHDGEKPTMDIVAVLQRLASMESGLSCSAVAVVVPDPAGLIEQARLILNEICFVGPFEIEFIKTSDGFKVLEFNPRFWLQHGVFIRANNLLIRRYLGMEVPSCLGGTILNQGTWVDGIWFLSHLFKGRFKVLQNLRMARHVGRSACSFFPSLRVSATILLRRNFSGKLSHAL